MNFIYLIFKSIVLSFAVTLALVGILFKFPTPSFNFLRLTNILAALVHGALAIFMFFRKQPLVVGSTVECLIDSNNEEYAFVTIKEIKTNDLVVYISDESNEFIVPKSSIVDSWMIRVKINKLIKPLFDKNENTFEKLIKIQEALNPKKNLVTITSLTKSTSFFSALTSIAHLIPIILNKYYNEQITNKQNALRWLEYMITSGIMMVNIANVNDIDNLGDTLSVLICTSITNAFGLAIEQTPSNFYKWAFMFLGFIPFALPWYMVIDRYIYIYKYFTEVLLDSFKDDELIFGKIPKSELKETVDENLFYVGIATGILFLLYFLFPVIQIYQIWFPNKYAMGELLFIIASLFSKVWLNIGVYFLGGRPNISKQYL